MTLNMDGYQEGCKSLLMLEKVLQHRVWQFLPICRFSLFMTFPVPIIAAWICHSKDIALLQWHDFYCSWETAWIVMAILWPCASFSLSTEFLLLTLTQTFPGNAFPLSSGQIAFYCLGHRPIRDPSAVWTLSEILSKGSLWPFSTNPMAMLELSHIVVNEVLRTFTH